MRSYVIPDPSHQLFPSQRRNFPKRILALNTISAFIPLAIQSDAPAVTSLLFHLSDCVSRIIMNDVIGKRGLLPAAGGVGRLQVMDNVQQSGDSVLVGCQAGLHALQLLLQAGGFAALRGGGQ